ncbi:MAG: type II secretion system F family protein [Clostridia bacterium]|nr:type II secretion system F family protein [Clostridia bacterium]
MVQNLRGFEYPLKDFYIVGYVLSNVIKLEGDFKDQFVKTLSMLEDNAYADYYAHLRWSQFLSFSYLLLVVGTIACSFISGVGAIFFFFIVIIFIAAVYYWFVAKYDELVANRKKLAESEFPNMVAKLALLINSGMVLRDAWKLIAANGEGDLYRLMRASCEEMDNGASDKEAIYNFGFKSDSQEIKKFTSSMLQAIEKGNSEIAEFFLQQNNELWEHKRQLSLQEGELAAGKLIIPLGITFAGIILIIIVAVFQSLSL